MITPANIHTARRLLTQWPAVNAARIAKDRKPYLSWLREAKPVAGFDPKQRPVGGVVWYSLTEQVKRYDSAAAHRATAKQPDLVPDIGGDPMPTTQADALPALPETITIHLPPFARKRAEELAAATLEADRSAGRAPIAMTLAALREHEADLRDKAKRQAAWVMDDTVVRLLTIAAHVREAIDLIETHAINDEDNG